MKSLTLFVLCLLTVQSFAQIETTDTIVAKYDAQIAQAEADEMEEIIPHISTTCPLILPAIGLVNHQIDIYFDQFREESEIEGEGIQTASTIRKVSFQIVSGSYQFDYTFHFDLAGNLIFHSERAEDPDYSCTLTSYYFDKQVKCIQLRSELLATEFCELPAENLPEIRTELSDIEKFTVKWIIKSASQYKELLAVYMDIMLN
ncbi:MAG: hypothetical protein GQ574_29330 [Crocinitomix sp.]|nr:hypothetical protein [Crocinitomix sp.]